MAGSHEGRLDGSCCMDKRVVVGQGQAWVTRVGMGDSSRGLEVQG